MRYRCKAGDVLDAICATHYGTEHGTTEMVLRENHGLADYGTHLPTGLVIELPDIVANPTPVTQQVSLWD
jgi:phage tail protein X